MVLQLVFTILGMQIFSGKFAFCTDEAIAVESYCPLGGRGNKGQVTDQLLADKTIGALAAAHGKTAAQVALRWISHQGAVAVTASSKASHDLSDLDIFDFNNREKGQTDTYFIPLVSESFELEATGTDGWLFDALSYDGSAVDRKSVV